MMRACAIVSVLGLAMAGAAGADDDDLAVVRRAVSQEARTVPATAARREVAKPSTAASPAPARNEGIGRTPRWLKIRVVEQGQKRGQVSVTLPFDLAQALAEEASDSRCDKHDGSLCLRDVARALAQLNSDNSILELDDGDSKVRIWVE